MTARNQNFEMFARDTKRIRFPVTQGGQPKPLVGAAIRWQMAPAPEAPPTLEKSLGAGIAILDAEAGLFEVTLEKADTADLAGRFYHEANVQDAAGDEATVAIGHITVRRRLIP